MVFRPRICVCMAAMLLAGLAVGSNGQGVPGAAGPRAGAKVVEGVVAVVGDTPILRSELNDRYAMLSPQFEIAADDTARANQLRREILDNLVSEQLLLQEAEGQGLKADQEQIDSAVASAIDGDRQRLGPDGFNAELTNEGITEADLRARYASEARKEILRRQLLQKEVVSKVTVTDAQVEQNFRENKDKIGMRPRALRVLDLFVRIAPDTLIETTYRKRAEEVRKEIEGGLSFEEAAKRYSDDEKTRDDGGLLGRFGPGRSRRPHLRARGLHGDPRRPGRPDTHQSRISLDQDHGQGSAGSVGADPAHPDRRLAEPERRDAGQAEDRIDTGRDRVGETRFRRCRPAFLG